MPKSRLEWPEKPEWSEKPESRPEWPAIALKVQIYGL